MKRNVFRQIPQEDLQDYQQKILHSYWHPLLLVGCLVLVFEAFMLREIFIRPNPFDTTNPRFVYFMLYLSLFTVTLFGLAYLICNRKRLEQKPHIFQRTYVAYVFFICYWGSFLTAYSHMTSADVSVFLYVAICVTIVAPLTPWQAIALYVSNWLLFFFALKMYIQPQMAAFPSQINTAFTSLLCIAIACILYNNRVRDYLNNKIIVEQSDKIQKMNDQLQAMVLVDELTQIYNRRYLEKELPAVFFEAQQRQEIVAACMVDIDHFKEYNDRYGHQAGDECLQVIASIIWGTAPKGCSHLMRYGGEEFLLLVTGVQADEAATLAEDIRAAVENAAIPHADRPQGSVTISVGLCVTRQNETPSLTQVIRYADEALYEAKQGGRNRVAVFGEGK